MTSPTLPSLPNTVRRSLLLGLPAGLALASPLGLVGCGGGGDATPADAPAPAAASTLPPIERSTVALELVLPVGTGVSLEDCRLMTGNNVSRVAADGTAGAVLLRGEPQMGYLMSADGRLLLMGAVEEGRTVLNSRTTAEALVYIASEVALLEPALQIALRKLLQTHAIVEPLRVAVEAALLRGGITDQDPELMAALIAAESVIRRRASAATPSAEGRERALRVTVDPADAVSGVLVKRDAAFNTVLLVNTFRRRTYAWVERVGYVDRDNQEHSWPEPVPLTDFDLSATTALSFDNLVIKVGDFLAGLASDIGLIGDYQQGTGPFSPTESASIFLPIIPDDAQSSLYRARVVGVGATAADALSSKEKQQLDLLLVATVWEDLVVPVMQTLVLPLISDRLGKAFQAEVQTLWLATIGVDVVNTAFLTPLLPNTLERVKQGDADGAFGAFWKELFSSNTWQDLLKQALNSLIIASVGADQPGPTVLDSSGKLVAVNLLGNELPGKVAQFQASLGKVAKIVVIVKAAATIADFAAMGKDWASSRQRSEFRLASSGTTLTFTPAAVSATPGSSIPLTAALGDTADLAAGSTIRYEWSVSGSAGGSLRNPANLGTGTAISTSSPTVDYVAADGAAPGATDKVDLKAILTDIGTSGSGVIAVAKAPAVVTIGAIRLLPASADFKATPSGERQEFTVEFSTAFGSGAGLVYEWSCASTYGSIGDNTKFSSSSSPSFRSALPSVSYTSNGTAVGGETEFVKLRVLRITSAPGAVSETAETVATLESAVHFGRIELMISPVGPTDVPTDTRFGLWASVKKPLPTGSAVVWNWNIDGGGSLENKNAFNSGAACAIDVVTGSAEGPVTVSVRATVVVPGTQLTTVVTEPVSTTLQVKKGLKTMTLSGGWTIEITVPATGFSQATAWVVVPKVSGAKSYAVRLTKPTPDTSGGVPFPSSRDFSPTSLGPWEDRGSSYWSGLSGGGGADPWATTNVVPWLTSRFSDMVVTVTVTL